MADTNITANDTVVKGVNSTNNYVRSESHLIDGSEFSGILGTGTHSLFTIPKGNLLVGLRAVALAATTSSGSATIQFKADINSTAEALHTAVGKADFAAGDIINLLPTAIKCYDADYPTTIQMTVATAALTAFKALVIAEYIPVTEFITAG